MNHLLLNYAIYNRDSRINNISSIDFMYFDMSTLIKKKETEHYNHSLFLSPIEGEISKWFDKKRWISPCSKSGANYSICSLLLVDIWYFNMARSPVI